MKKKFFLTKMSIVIAYKKIKKKFLKKKVKKTAKKRKSVKNFFLFFHVALFARKRHFWAKNSQKPQKKMYKKPR